MTNRNDMIRQIEEMLGGEGSPEMAEAMFNQLKAAGDVTFDAARGFVMNGDESAWGYALTAALEEASNA
jgi:hypothetical protein